MDILSCGCVKVNVIMHVYVLACTHFYMCTYAYFQLHAYIKCSIFACLTALANTHYENISNCSTTSNYIKHHSLDPASNSKSTPVFRPVGLAIFHGFGGV